MFTKGLSGVPPEGAVGRLCGPPGGGGQAGGCGVSAPALSLGNGIRPSLRAAGGYRWQESVRLRGLPLDWTAFGGQPAPFGR